MDIKIDSLRITFENAAGHEHRLRPIAARAAAIFAERLSDCEGLRDMANLSASPVNVNLDVTTDEEAAYAISRAWLEALKLKLS